MGVIVYDNGEKYEIDPNDIYDPFPKKEEPSREKNVSYNEEIEGEKSPSKAVR